MVYVNMCDVRMSVLTLRDQRRTLGSLLHHYLPYPFEARTLLEPGADELCLGSTVNHKDSNPSVSPHSLIAGVTGRCGTMPCFLHGCWDPNSGPYVWAASALMH